MNWKTIWSDKIQLQTSFLLIPSGDIMGLICLQKKTRKKGPKYRVIMKAPGHANQGMDMDMFMAYYPEVYKKHVNHG